MTVLLTGGTGFVGLNVAEALLGNGQAVVALDRGPAPEAALAALGRIGPAFTSVGGSVTDSVLLEGLFQAHAFDYVVHAAAVTAGRDRERRAAREIAETNLLGTIEVLEAARRHHIRRLLYLSSASVYGEMSQADDTLDESTTAAVPDSLYAISKYAGERTALRYATLHGMEIVCARLSAVFGPWERDTGVRDTLSPILQVMQSCRRGEEVVLSRAGERDWVYARDVGRAVLALLTAPSPLAHGVYNIGSGERWSVADWCEKLAERRPDFRWRIGENATVDLHGPTDRHPLSIRRVTTDTDWRPAFGLQAAFEDYVVWLESTGAEGMGR